MEVVVRCPLVPSDNVLVVEGDEHTGGGEVLVDVGGGKVALRGLTGVN